MPEKQNRYAKIKLRTKRRADNRPSPWIETAHVVAGMRIPILRRIGYSDVLLDNAVAADACEKLREREAH